MGLAEKRKIEELKTKMTDWEKKIHTATGSTFPIEVNWETIVTEETIGHAEDSFEKVFIESSIKGFNELCQDQMGKDAVKESVQKVLMQNSAGVHYGDRWCTFKDGMVTLDHTLSNVGNVDERAKGLVDSISKSL